MNFKKLSIIVFVLAMLVLTVKGAVALTPPSGGISYYDFSSVTDLWGSNDATNNGANSSSSFPSFNISGDSSPNSYYFDGTNDFIQMPVINQNYKTISLWFNSNVTLSNATVTNNRLLGQSGDSVYIIFGTITGSCTNEVLTIQNNAGKQCFTTADISSFSNGTWYNLVFSYNDTQNKYNLYINGINKGFGSGGSTVGILNNTNFKIGDYSGSDYFKGFIDEVKFYNNSKNSSEAINIYNYGIVALKNFSITAVDAWNGSSILSFNATINGTTYNTSTGKITTTILSNSSSLWNITLTADDYTTRTYEDYNVSSNLAAELYPFNSLDVFAFDIASGTNLSNFSVTLQSVSDYYFNETNSSLVRFDDLVSGEYSARVDSDGYSTGFYVVSVNNSHQFLYAYLTSSFDNVTFKVVDAATSGVLEGATVVQKRFINGSLTTIQSKNTDITGRVIMAYQDTIEYTFEIYMDGYVTKTFSLSPSFDEYIIRLSPKVTSNPDIRNDDVLRNLLGYAFTNGTSWIAYEFDSYLGSLESYSVNVSLLNGSSYVVSGYSASGSNLNNSFVVPVVTYGDYANVIVCYKSTFNTYESCFSNAYPFSSWDEQFGNLGNLKVFFSDRSEFEKSFIAVTIILILAGLFSVVGFVVGDGVVMSMFGGVFGVVLSLLIGLLTLASGGFIIFIFFMLIIGWYGKNG